MNFYKRCLIIDDDPDDQELFLLAAGDLHEAPDCIFANNGVEGLALLNGLIDLPDFIFLDLNMPKMGGKECLIKIKENPRFKEIPVVIISTSSQHTHREEMQELGALDFITKPPHVTQLTKRLEEIFEKHPVHRD